MFKITLAPSVEYIPHVNQVLNLNLEWIIKSISYERRVYEPVDFRRLFWILSHKFTNSSTYYSKGYDRNIINWWVEKQNMTYVTYQVATVQWKLYIYNYNYIYIIIKLYNWANVYINIVNFWIQTWWKFCKIFSLHLSLRNQDK